MKTAINIEPSIWNTDSEVLLACRNALEIAGSLRQKVLDIKDELRTKENTLEPINNILFELHSFLALSELFSNVHPEESVRNAAEAGQQEVMKFVSAFELDREVYDALAATDVSCLDLPAQRFVKLLLRDYRLSGVDKDEETRARLALLREEAVKTGQDFSRIIREDRKSIYLSKEETSGLPEELLNPRLQEDGTYKFTTDGPDFTPVVNYANQEDVRRRMVTAHLQKGYPANDANLTKLLTLRKEIAGILGYQNWVAYNAADMMANKPEIISEFIDKVADIARPRMKEELKELLERKQKDIKEADTIRSWDRFYYVNQIKAERFGVDSKALRAYFEYDRVIKGILDLIGELYGVVFERIDNAKVWHEDVQAYNMLENGEIAGRIYLDMHPRDGKYGHAAEFGMLPGITERQIPSASLVCNFPKPSKDTPALLEHDQVVTIFHEFGHLMHQILAGRHAWVTMSGISCEGDFIEVPSQIFENWAWEHQILSRFAVHYQTGEVIPKDLVEKMKAAEEFGRGVHVMRQMYFAGLSFTYHSVDPENLNLLEVVMDMQKKYSPYPYEQNTYIYAGFGHLEGYSSAYYTYMWSLALSEDMFTRFQAEGLMNPKIASEYRRYILEPGGTVDAEDMAKNFLGRESSFEALRNYLEPR